MCMVSQIGQAAGTSLPGMHPWINNPSPQWPSRAEFDALKREVIELRKLLEAAREYDRATGQPDCEQEEKVELLKKIAGLVGVDLGSVLDA